MENQSISKLKKEFKKVKILLTSAGYPSIESEIYINKEASNLSANELNEKNRYVFCEKVSRLNKKIVQKAFESAYQNVLIEGFNCVFPSHIRKECWNGLDLTSNTCHKKTFFIEEKR
jgi:hypothetical protein